MIGLLLLSLHSASLFETFIVADPPNVNEVVLGFWLVVPFDTSTIFLVLACDIFHREDRVIPAETTRRPTISPSDPNNDLWNHLAVK